MTQERIKGFLDDVDKHIAEMHARLISMRSTSAILRAELEIHANLSRICGFSAADMHEMPPIQQQSIAQVIINQGRLNFKKAWFEIGTTGCVMLQFNDILIGVEKDGYAHS